MTGQSATPAPETTNGSRVGLDFMLVAVVSYAVIPALVGAIGGEKAPFFFLAAWRMGVGAGCLMVLAGFLLFWLFRGKVRGSLRDVRSHFNELTKRSEKRARKWVRPFGVLAKWPVLLGVLILGNCDYALFAWSIDHLNIAVTAALFGTWVIISYALSPVLPRKQREETESEQNKPAQWILLIVLTGLGFVGYFFIISSEIERWEDFRNIDTVKRLASGFALAIGAMVLTQFKELGINVGKDLNSPGPDSNTQSGDPGYVLLFGLLLISSMGAALLSSAVGMVMNEPQDVDLPMLGWAFAGGLLVNTFAGFMWRKAKMSDDDDADRIVKVFGLMLPVGVLLFLVIFQLVDLHVDFQELGKVFTDLRLEYFILGYTTIVAASLLIQFRLNIRWSFEALILALGGCGTFVYFREELLDLWLGNDQWSWTSDGYFGSIALVATVFTLLLAFRVARLVARTRDEENRTFSLLRKLDRLSRDGGMDDRVRQCIVQIDNTNSQCVLKKNYEEARDDINSARALPYFQNEPNRQALSEVEAELDMLVSSKQTTSILGEIFALLVFAGVTIALALFTIPSESRPWIRLLLDLFAMLVSSVVIFLMIYSLDLDRQRDANKLTGPTGYNQEYRLNFPNTNERLFEQYLSVIGGIAIIGVYAVLLANKWGIWEILPETRF